MIVSWQGYYHVLEDFNRRRKGRGRKRNKEEEGEFSVEEENNPHETVYG